MKGQNASEVKRKTLTSGDVIRLLKPQVDKTLRYEKRTRGWRFRRLDSIETNSIKR